MSVNAPALSIHLFGPLRILVRGEPLPRVRTRSVEWLLALLVLRHDRTVDRAWLAGTLWPESRESRARQNLCNDLMHLRKALGSESRRIQSLTRDSLAFDLEGAEVDVVRFDAAIQVGDDRSLQDAVGVYAGPLLEGCYEEWARDERERRAEQFLNALENLAERAQERSDHAEAIRHLRRAEALDPLRDSIVRQLMTCLATTGDPAAAIEVYRQFRIRLHEEIAAQPDAATVQLFDTIRAEARTRAAGRRASPVSTPPAPVQDAFHVVRTPLPAPLTPLIGRDQDVREVGELLQHNRLVTLIGGGGVGKTRLAIEAAAQASEEFPDGAVWVELAPLTDGALLLPSIAVALGMREEEGDRETLSARLEARFSSRPPLLVLDNCEHLLDAVAGLVRTLLQRSGSLHILATSRQRLGLAGEVGWRVPSLAVPDPKEIFDFGFSILDDTKSVSSIENRKSKIENDLFSYPAVQLFVERAAAIRTEFCLANRDDVAAVCQICCRLDGIPLALELAAARVQSLTLRQIAERLDDRFRLLTTGSRGVLPRHKTLRALIDWSYDQLPLEERALLRRLAVFAGEWTLDACEAVADRLTGAREEGRGKREEETATAQHPNTQHPDAQRLTPNASAVNSSLFPLPSSLDSLDSLVDRSLVLLEERGGHLRYRMQETVREYALEKLRESGEEQAARNQHLAYYLQLAEEIAPEWNRSDPEEALSRVESEIGNFRVALAWSQIPEASADAALRLAASLWPYWEMQGSLSEGREVLRVALNSSTASDGPERAQVLLGAATLAFVQAELDTALEFGRESLPLFRQLNDPRSLAAALILCGHACLESNVIPDAVSLLEEALEGSRQCDWARGSALALTHLGLLAMRQEEGDRAQTLLEQGLAAAEAVRHAPTIALALMSLGYLTMGTGDYSRAVLLLERSLGMWRRLGHKSHASQTLRFLGQATRGQGNLERAVSCFEETVAICREQGHQAHLAIALHEYGNVLYEQRKYERASTVYSESLDLLKQTSSNWGLDCARNNLGSTLFHLGASERAQTLHREALDIYQRKQSLEGIAWSLERLAVVEAADGDAQKAARLLGAASVVREGLGKPLDRWDQEDWNGAVVSVRATLGETAFERLWAEGGAFTLKQAIAYA